MSTPMAAWLSAGLVIILLIAAVVFMGRNTEPAEAPTFATSTVATTTDAGGITIPFPDNGEEKWTK